MIVSLLDNVIRLLPKLCLLALYLFCSGIIIIYFNELDPYAVKAYFFQPINTYKYLYHYIKWLVYYGESAEMKYYLYTITSLAIPYCIYYFLKAMVMRLIKIINKIALQCIKSIWKSAYKKGNKKTVIQSTIKPVFINPKIAKDKREQIKHSIMEDISKKIDEAIKKSVDKK